jgi:hypothetical protein
MSGFLNHQLTDVGWDALSTALGGGRLTFFKMQAGSGTIANDSAIPPMTALVQPVYDIAITSYIIEGDGQITLIGNINSELLDNGFTFKELGVFATIEPPVLGFGGTPGGTGIQVIEATPGTQANPIIPNPPAGTPLMYSYTNAYALSDYIPGKNESTNVVNTVQVTIKIDDVVPTIVITPGVSSFAVVNIGPPSVGPGVWSFTNANVANLKRLVAGAGMVLTEDANTITVATKQLTADLDLFVANGNPDISPNFSTIQNAMSYLGQFMIPTTIKARIHVSRGVYTMPITGQSTGWQHHTDINHPNAQSITIQGPQYASRTGTGVTSITGSAFNWTVTVGGVSNTADFQVNDYCIVDNINKATGNNHGTICGFFKVTAKTGSTVSYLVPYYNTSFSVAGINTIQLTPIGAILTPATNVQGIHVGITGIGLLQYIGVVALGAPTKRMAGINIEGNSVLKYCGAYNFDSVLNANNDNIVGGIQCMLGASTYVISCGASKCQNGFLAAATGGLIITRCAASNNSLNGYWLDGAGSSHFWEGISYAAGNDWNGIMVSAGHVCLLHKTVPNGSLYSHINTSNGLLVSGRGFCQLAPGNFLRIDGNGSVDIRVQALGAFIGQADVTGSRTFSQTVGSISSDGSLIA